MIAPSRIQLSRAKGWRMPEDTVKVDRATKWGNPWRTWRDPYAKGGARWMVSRGGEHYQVGEPNTRYAAAALAVQLYREDLLRAGSHHHRLVDPVATRTDVMKALRGKHLACWCKLGTPCHADVLLEIANGPVCTAVHP